jgi:hypothetical protein
MRKNVFARLLAICTIAVFLVSSGALAQRGCCSHHGGVCGDACCDGTPLSAKCGGGSKRVYNSTQSAPAPSSTVKESTPATTTSIVEESVPTTATSSENDQYSVMYNTSSHKYHCPSCTWAIKCTRNCISITAADAKSRGGIPCKVCGGRCGR